MITRLRGISSMKMLINIWIAIAIFLSFEFITIKYYPRLSISNFIAKNILHHKSDLEETSVRVINYYLGWIGLGLMVIMNVYSLRKRMGIMRKWGQLKNWLNFHIFCGLLGPTFILFHSNFKVRGLVAISFWSMVVSFSSGIIGRYFYGQLSRSKKELNDEAELIKSKISPELAKLSLSPEHLNVQQHEKYLLQFVGCPMEDESTFSALFSAINGDFRLLLRPYPRFRKLSQISNKRWLHYSLLKRKAVLFENFEALMGYWHVFHTPFAFFMYIAAVIHVISAMIFAIK